MTKRLLTISTSIGYFAEAPQDIKKLIVSYLHNPKDLRNLEITCKSWKKIVELQWQFLASQFSSEKPSEVSWKAHYDDCKKTNHEKFQAVLKRSKPRKTSSLSLLHRNLLT